MKKMSAFKEELEKYTEYFDTLCKQYDHTDKNYEELEKLIDEYSKFILDDNNKEVWKEFEKQNSSEFNNIVKDLRKKSAIGVAIMEKCRALKLQNENLKITNYFNNIETCIDKEIAIYQITPKSKVLSIGSGSFPITLLLIAKRTGAEVVGIDIDPEAIKLGSQVVGELGSELNVKLEQISLNDVPNIKGVTHIIFSSTVELKYKILDELYSVVGEDVVVAMRYGNGLKSLFNYPLQKVDNKKWKIVDNIVQSENIFDIALYEKV